MADTRRDIRVADDSADQAGDTRVQAPAVAAVVARMLANPRRVRRA